MAGENFKVLKGPSVNLRVTADKDYDAGDYYFIPQWIGSFWLHSVKKDEVGEVCIYAPIVDAPNNKRAHKAGTPLAAKANGIDYATVNKARGEKDPYFLCIVYENVTSKEDRMKVVWGLF